MAQDQPHPHAPFELDARDANFARAMLLWASQTHSEIRELVTATRRTIEISRALMAEADRILDGKIGLDRHLG